MNVGPTPTPAVEQADLPLQAYGAIGNCRTLALISNLGSVDWLCLPHFSGSSIFAALLDRERGGNFAIRPRHIVATEQRYCDRTNVLETIFHVTTGVLRLIDFMPMVCGNRLAPQHELARIAECVAGTIELEALYRPRLDYGRAVARLVPRGTLGWVFSDRGTAVYMHSDIPFVPQADGALRATATLRAGQSVQMSMTACHNDVATIAPLGEELRQRLTATLQWWRTWVSRCNYDGRFRDAVLRSCLVLKLLQYHLSGAIIAAPTTSLPERLEADTQWDYRYCWLRDASLVLEVFIDCGFRRECDAFLQWLLHATRLTHPRLQIMYDVYGETRLTERELPHLTGYRGAAPVRVGNAAHHQLQLDVYGEVISAVERYVQRGGSLDPYQRRLLVRFGEAVCRLWRQPDHGFWEVRSPPRHYTHSKLMCWVALDRLIRLAQQIGLEIDVMALQAQARAIRADIEARGFSGAVGSFVAHYDGVDADAALLAISRHGFLSPNDPRMLGTWRYLEQQLRVDRFIRRYRCGGSGESAPDGLFAACSFWRADYLARSGSVDEAERLFETLLRAATPLGLYAEEFEPRTKAPMGNFPQAFTHLELVATALTLERARREREKAE